MGRCVKGEGVLTSKEGSVKDGIGGKIKLGMPLVEYGSGKTRSYTYYSLWRMTKKKSRDGERSPMNCLVEALFQGVIPKESGKGICPKTKNIGTTRQYFVCSKIFRYG